MEGAKQQMCLHTLLSKYLARCATFQQCTSVPSPTTDWSKHASHWALHMSTWKICNRFNNLSKELYVTDNAKCQLAPLRDFSHCVWQMSSCPRRLKWWQSVCRSTVLMHLGATLYATMLGICLTFVCIFICTQNSYCVPVYAYLAVWAACGTPLKGKQMGG